jgi:DNA-binding transcriptional LysR family regulator
VEVYEHTLPTHRFIGYISEMLYAPELDFLEQLGLPTHVASNSASVQLALLRAGAGLGVVHDFAMSTAPELVRVLPDKMRFEREFYLLRHGDEARSERGQRLARLLARGVRAEIGHLESMT